MATITNVNRRILSGSGIAEIHAKPFLDLIDSLIAELNGRKTFISTEIVADGTEQEITHGLGAVPTKVAVLGVTHVPDTGYGAGSGKPYTITEGTHTSTKLKFTATTGVKFKVMAMLIPA